MGEGSINYPAEFRKFKSSFSSVSNNGYMSGSRASVALVSATTTL